MDNQLWHKSTFSINAIPNWICPHCQINKLKLHKENFHFEESARSKNNWDDEYWEPEWTQYTFSGLLKCDNEKCQEIVAIAGRGWYELSSQYIEATEELSESVGEVFTPLYFYPPLNLFKIPEKCPDIIKNEILNAFSLFWSDIASSVNKIRIALELLMDSHKIKKFNISKGKRARVSLHNRLLDFQKNIPDVAQYLLAIKWIGNAGSHVGGLEKVDHLDALALLEYALNKLYNDNEKMMVKLSKSIVKAKGPLSKRRKDTF